MEIEVRMMEILLRRPNKKSYDAIGVLLGCSATSIQKIIKRRGGVLTQLVKKQNVRVCKISSIR